MGKPDLSDILRRLDAVERKTAHMEKVIMQLPPWVFKALKAEDKKGEP